MRRASVIPFLVLLAASPAAAQLQGQFANYTIESKVLGEERAIIVRTPPGYDRQTRTYPVLYLTDGDRQIGHTAATVEFLAREGRMPEMIIVGIGNTDRTRDLTPTRASFDGGDGRLIDFPTAGGAENFLSFIETELIPWTESSYRTEPLRLFAGHSFGGMFAFYTLVERPELFRARIAVSPTFTWDDRWILRNVRELTRERTDIDGTLVYTMGNEGEALAKGFREIGNHFRGYRSQSFSASGIEYPEDDHGSLVMASHHDALRRIFSNWPMPRDANGRIAGGFEGVREHYRKLSAQFGYEIPIPEGVVNFLGYQQLQGGDVDAAIAIFRENARAYPDSANVYDSLAEALEHKGALDEARENYAKAVANGEKLGDPNLPVFRQNLARVSTAAE